MRNARNKTRQILLAAACLSLALTACGGGKDKEGALGSAVSNVEANSDAARGGDAASIQETKLDSQQAEMKPVQETQAPSEAQEEMRAVVKEIDGGTLLVSSRTDRFPGAYYVYLGDIDPDGIEAGDEITIYWNGIVLETDPAQIYADAIALE